ncbi:MAG: helix-turn-helix transcriptional regulator [Lachnospiraceae bacterium]|jgi:putative transcriptional regulator|nr:helix-turn-helix transcriptional regulator [Lachnospiraceae bacterium]
MRDIDYGHIRIKLKDIMEKQNVSINRLACRAEMQRTQLKAYMNEDIQRIDLCVLARICYVLECELDELITYERP